MDYATLLKYFPYANAVYGTTDANPTPIPVGNSAPVAVETFTATPGSGFDGALYKDPNTGKYILAFAGSVQLGADWLQADPTLAAQRITSLTGEWAGSWHPQMTDALNFAYAAVKQIRDDLFRAGNDNPTMDDIRAVLDVTGHSLGGALAEMVSKFFGLSGANIDGPGVSTLVGLSNFTQMQDRVAADVDLLGFQRNYQLPSGDFTANAFSIVGMVGTHLEGTNFDAETKATVSFYAGSTLIVLGGSTGGLTSLAGLGVLANSVTDHPMGAILGKIESALNMPSVGSLPAIDAVGLGNAPLGGLGAAPELDLFYKTPSATTYAVAAKWVAETQSANAAAGLSPSGIALDGTVVTRGGYSVIAFRDEITGRINEIYTPLQGGAPIKREFVVSADGQVGTFTNDGKLQFLVAGENGAFGVAELQPDNKMLFTSFTAVGSTETYGYASDANTAAALRSGNLSLRQTLEDFLDHILRILGGDTDTSLTLGGQQMQALQLERGGVVYNLDANGDFIHNLESGVADVIDSQGNRYLQDGNGNRILVTNDQTIAVSDSGLASIVPRQRIDATSAVDLPQVIVFQDNGLATRLDLTASGQLLRKSTLQTFDDGSIIGTISYLNGDIISLTTNADGSLYQKSQTLVDGVGNTDTTVTDGAGKPVSNTHIDYFYDENGVSRIETVDTVTGTVRNTYDTDGALYSSETLPPGAIADLSNAQVGTIFNDVSGLIGAIKAGQPLPTLASGLRLLNDLSVANGSPMPSLTAASQVAAGALSFYNLYNAMNSDNDFAKVNATLSTINYANIALNSTANGAFAAGSSAAGLNSALNGTANGALGILPALGLISAIQNGDPVGAAMSIGVMMNPAFLSTPLGWCLIAVSILSALMEEGPPDAWGVANVTFGPGITDYSPQIHAIGENFGTERARNQLQSTIDALTSLIAQHNAAAADSSQWLGIIPQRLASLNYKAAEFADKGYSVTDIDALSGEQRFANLRFDDNGQLFGVDPASITPVLRALLGVEGAPGYPQLNAYMLNSALARQALAPLWEVQTAKLQGQAGDPNAGLLEEERAAKAGLAAGVDSAYVQSHPQDANASAKHIGHFMPVGIDLDRSGSVSTLSIAQTEARHTAVSFDWDGTGYQKQTGWIGAEDGFLVLDRNFNQSVDNGAELLSNPLVADPAKGLRSLAAFDANGDGRIDALDPVYAQLKVWQDLDQDGNNTHSLQVGSFTETAQDESGGVKELRSLADWGISAIDYGNSRYEFGSASGTNGVGYASIATQTLEAQDEGVRYTPVGAGIRIDATNGTPEVVVTQVQSEAAVYSQYTLETANETIGVPGAELYEDGTPGAYNPNTQGGPITITLSAAQLLGNDTWHGATGEAAGLVISAVGNASHLGGLALTAEGNVSLTLEANYSGVAGFDYTVTAPDGQSRASQVALNITAVNDVPTVSVVADPSRPIYDYPPLTYSLMVQVGSGDSSYDALRTGSIDGAPVYAPYVQTIPGAPIYAYVGGSDGYETIVGYEPATYVNHFTPIAMESSDAGTVTGSDPDSSVAFTYEVVANALYGKAAVDPVSGRWSYIGTRPSDVEVADISGDGVADWVDLDSGAVSVNAPRGNIDSNRHGGTETQFYDYFTVRVHDGLGGFADTQVQATHYGPPPVAVVAGSGGKKPIAIDLDGDGFQFTDVDDSNVFFDVNGDGWKRQMAWTSPGDGLLAFDRDGNGKIDRFDEISFVPYANSAQTDLAALKQAFDTNGNGVLDAGDEKWASFGVWQDANSNGVTDPGEFKNLSELGINQIGLTSDGQFQVIDGQTVHGVASAHKTDGSTLAMADVTLRYKNVTQVTTTLADGSTATSPVEVPTFQLGQEFIGTPDKDLVFGTRGSDSFKMGDGDDVVVDNGGNDIVEAGAGKDLIYTGIDNDIVNAGADNDTVFAGAGNDLVFGDGANETGDDVLMLEDGNDVAFGGNGNDFLGGGTGNDVLSGNQGDDKLFGEVGWDALFGQEGDDELWGLDGNDLLDGGAGNDLLAGGAGDDVMQGGAGDDIYEVDSAADVVDETAGGAVDGTPGTGDAGGVDTVRASVSYVLGALLENLTLTATGDLTGTGNAADNVLVGNAGRDTLTGLAGNDLLDGGIGADTLIGGAGDDTYMVDNAGDVVIEAVTEGLDTVRSRVSLTLADNVENLTLVGINAIDGTGNTLDNTLTGNTASNLLDGGAGTDVMQGGTGDDTYIVDNTDDQVVELAGQGLDTVLSGVSFSLSDNVEVLTLTGVDDINGVGNMRDNILTGNTGHNLLDGGAGADAMAGGAGDDAYIVDDTVDTVLELENEGIDTARASVGTTLWANVENLTLMGSVDINGTGNDLGNILTGNAGANVLDGGVGVDTLVGGQGDDSYVVDNAGDVVIEAPDEGSDTVQSCVSYTLSANVENLTLVGINAIDGSGNTLDNTLTGNTASNLLDGGLGADVMRGNHGDDTYQVDNVGDVVVENAGEGLDTILSSVDYTLSADVENLSLIANAVSGTGNELDNSLTGNVGHNLLDGGAGADVMAGGAGDDSYVVDNAGDRVTEWFNDGIDTVAASINYVLPQYVENLLLTGAAVSGWGNELDNQITGNAQDNWLDGGSGADTLAGGTGNDTYLIDNASDTVVELQNEGVDTVQARVSASLSANVENLILTGSADISVSGNDLDNTLTGNAGSNTLSGGLGNDLLYGNDGNDLLYGGDGNDSLFGGNDDDQLSGEAGDDVLKGDNGNDRLVDTLGNNRFFGGNGEDYVLAGAGVDTINTENGRDIVQSGAGADTVRTDNDNDLVDAGAGNDTISTGNGADWIAGGRGNDSIDAGLDRNLFAFNQGDGADTISNSESGSDTVSLGQGIRYANLKLAKTGKDLVLDMADGDSMTFKNWYANTKSRGVSQLQVITVGGDYDAASADKTRNHQVEVFDFAQLVQKFDAARTANIAQASGWSVMNSLLDAHLSGSDTQALGGDLSFQYATAGSLSGIGLLAAQSSLTAGTGMQALKTRSQLEQDAVLLA